jgi:WXG100 family type VII secretion target
MARWCAINEHARSRIELSVDERVRHPQAAEFRPRRANEYLLSDRSRRKEPTVSGLKVTPDQLSTMSTSVARVSTQVRGEHQTLRAQLAPLFGVEWSGAAASQFTALYEQFDRSSQGLSDALDGIGLLLGRAATTYRDAETSVAASFR